MSETITTASALETIIGKTPGSMNLKVIDHLDEGALHWISKSPVIFAAFGGASSIGITLCGGAPGFAGGDNRELRLPTAMIDDPSLARPGLGFGAVVLLPGVSETMRGRERASRVSRRPQFPVIFRQIGGAGPFPRRAAPQLSYRSTNSRGISKCGRAPEENVSTCQFM